MIQVTARLPDDIADILDATASRLNRSRAEIIRQAIEHYLEEADDLAVVMERLLDPADPILEWDSVRNALLDKN